MNVSDGAVKVFSTILESDTSCIWFLVQKHLELVHISQIIRRRI